jgi:hypothetical protein
MFCPEAISSVSRFAFSNLQSLNLRKSCQSLASPNSGSIHILVGKAATAAFDPIYVALVAVAQQLTSCVVDALGSHRAGGTGTRLGLVEDLVSGCSEGLGPQDFALPAGHW